MSARHTASCCAGLTQRDQHATEYEQQELVIAEVLAIEPRPRGFCQLWTAGDKTARKCADGDTDETCDAKTPAEAICNEQPLQNDRVHDAACGLLSIPDGQAE